MMQSNSHFSLKHVAGLFFTYKAVLFKSVSPPKKEKKKKKKDQQSLILKRHKRKKES